MTPESSEQPRETRDGMPLVERFDAVVALRREREAHEAGAAESAKADAVRDSYVLGAKVSSPELASLAAKYVNVSEEDVYSAASQHGDMSAFVTDVRALAASVLAQAAQRTDPNGAYKP